MQQILLWLRQKIDAPCPLFNGKLFYRECAFYHVGIQKGYLGIEKMTSQGLYEN